MVGVMAHFKVFYVVSCYGCLCYYLVLNLRLAFTCVKRPKCSIIQSSHSANVLVIIGTFYRSIVQWILIFKTLYMYITQSILHVHVFTFHVCTCTTVAYCVINTYSTHLYVLCSDINLDLWSRTCVLTQRVTHTCKYMYNMLTVRYTLLSYSLTLAISTIFMLCIIYCILSFYCIRS